MFGRYALPSDDLIYRLRPTITASAGDAAYPATNWYDQKPAKPAKLTTTSGSWVFDFGAAVNAAAIALIYHQIDAGVVVKLAWNSANSWGSPIGSITLTIPAATEDGWTVNPWGTITGTPSARYWRLEVALTGSANTYPISVGRPLLVGALRDLGNDVRWGVEEDEDHNLIEQASELGVETIYNLGGKRRRFSGEFALLDATTATLISLYRSAHGRVLPWLLIPDATINEAWMVRFEDSRWARVRESPDQNILPYHVQELARGLPWP